MERIKRQRLEAASFDDSTLSGQKAALKEYGQLCDYKAKLDKYNESQSFEQLDKQLTDVKGRLSPAVKTLWNKWLITCAPQIPDTSRAELSSFLAQIELNDGDAAGLAHNYRKIEELLSRLMPICAVTSLSARGRLPFSPGYYDLAIIDEASQCDIASIIPLLYRTKRTVIIGDSNQLKHITTMTRRQDKELVEKHQVDALFSYCVHSLFDLAVSVGHGSDLTHLRDHHRSHANIIEFSNKQFYNGMLRIATNYARLKFPFGQDKSIMWKNVEGQTIRPQTGGAFNQKEIDAVIMQLAELIEANYQGTIGVVTPFKRQAELINYYLNERHNALLERLVREHDFIAATAHKFQGDERDVIIFSPVVSNGSPQGTLNFLSNTPNLFNVAITRARAAFIVVGNKSYCQNSCIQYLAGFANYVQGLDGITSNPTTTMPHLDRQYPIVNTSDIVSGWERALYTALYDRGIQTIPQYEVDKYHIDLALIGNGNKLAIEVGDNAEYNSEQCYAVHLRNSRLIELGWDVIRFMPWQLKDDMEWCVNTVLRGYKSVIAN